MWIAAILLFGISAVARVGDAKGSNVVITNPWQLVVESDDATVSSYTVTLDGSSSTPSVIATWTQVSKPDGADDAIILNAHQLSTNVTIGRGGTGTYKFKLSIDGANGGRHKNRAFSEVVVEDISNVGMSILSHSVVGKLLEMQYMYLAMSHHYRRSDNFYPNVAKYYRSLSTSRAAMLDQVMKYILAKQATVDLLHFYPPNYVNTMMTRGLATAVTIPASFTNVMTSSFEGALKSEKELGGQLALISHLAENNRDFELSHLAGADMIPLVTKSINEHKNHLETILRKVQAAPNRHLAEFLFDKHLSVSD